MVQAKKTLLELLPLINSSPKAKELMDVFSRTFKFELDDGKKPIYMIITKRQMMVPEGISGEVDIIATGNGFEFTKVLKGEIDVTHLIARGDLVIKKGKISEMTLLNRILLSSKRR